MNILLNFDAKRVHGPFSALSDREFVAAAESGAVQLKVTDFSLARFLPAGVLADDVGGTPLYMAPEVLTEKRYDAKADLFSLGVIIYECLTGTVPFKQTTRQTLKEFYQNNAALRPVIPEQTSSELADFILRLLQRDAKDRIGFSDLCSHPFLCGRRSQKSEPPVKVLQTGQNVAVRTIGNQTTSSQKWYVLGGGESRRFQTYDVSRRFWTVEADLPWTRHEAGAGVLANRLVVLGGRRDGTFNFTDIEEYDSSASEWLARPTALQEGRCNMAVCTNGQDAYAIGGLNYDVSSVVERFNAASNRVTTLTHLTSPRHSSAAVFAANSIYVAGGCSTEHWLDCIEQYDVVANRWSQVARLSAGRRDLAATLSGDDLYLAGGIISAVSDASVRTVEIFNIRTGQIRQARDLIFARGICFAATIDDGNVVCVLGEGTRQVQTYDVREGRWSTGVMVPDMREEPQEGFTFAA